MHHVQNGLIQKRIYEISYLSFKLKKKSKLWYGLQSLLREQRLIVNQQFTAAAKNYPLLFINKENLASYQWGFNIHILLDYLISFSLYAGWKAEHKAVTYDVELTSCTTLCLYERHWSTRSTITSCFKPCMFNCSLIFRNTDSRAYQRKIVIPR